MVPLGAPSPPVNDLGPLPNFTRNGKRRGDDYGLNATETVASRRHDVESIARWPEEGDIGRDGVSLQCEGVALGPEWKEGELLCTDEEHSPLNRIHARGVDLMRPEAEAEEAEAARPWIPPAW
ncbi:hypothetical protein ZWY2020_003172 [Hordeum vulgare]|nr:hypothetical protein ZWY2020_003172 [Hordeum vulgare]